MVYNSWLYKVICGNQLPTNVWWLGKTKQFSSWLKTFVGGCSTVQMSSSVVYSVSAARLVSSNVSPSLTNLFICTALLKFYQLHLQIVNIQLLKECCLTITTFSSMRDCNNVNVFPKSWNSETVTRLCDLNFLEGPNTS